MTLMNSSTSWEQIFEKLISGFPYKDPRPQQVEILEHIAKNFDKTFFLVEAPTGVGKSAIAMSLARSLDRSYILTSTKALQDQYAREFNDVQNLKGKSNYPCDLNRNFNAATAPCNTIYNLVKDCRDKMRCSYYAARDRALLSPIFLTSYHYFLSSIETGALSIDFERSYGSIEPKRNLIVLDEGHDAESILSEHSSFIIDLTAINLEFDMDLDIPRDNETIDQTIDIILKRLRTKRDNLYERISETVDNVLAWERGDATKISQNASKQIETVTQDHNRISRLIKRIEFYYNYRNNGDWIAEAEEVKDKKIIRVVCTKPDVAFKMNIIPKADKFLIMSASLGDPKIIMDEFGIDPDQATYISVGSPFDPAKSPIHLLPEVSFSYKNGMVYLEKTVDLLKTIMDIHSGEKGIIHTGTYKVTDAIYELMPPDYQERLIAQTGRKFCNNEILLDEHAKSKRPTILLSPSMHTGVDLVDDLSRFQIIVKLPYGNLSDLRVKKRLKVNKEQRWYTNDMVKRVVQACGRSTRNEDDYSETYIIDAGFDRVWKDQRDCLPTSFIERVSNV